MNFGVSGIIEKNVCLLAASTKNYAYAGSSSIARAGDDKYFCNRPCRNAATIVFAP
jgi:hypothetical protein